MRTRQQAAVEMAEREQRQREANENLARYLDSLPPNSRHMGGRGLKKWAKKILKK